jgi:orotidine-5'-phosphate decarboxylase
LPDVPVSERPSAGAAAVAQARSRLIFALDVDTVAAAERLVDELLPEVGLFKIGKQLFVHAGPGIVRWVRRCGGEVFLDLKFHDIPRTAARAAVEAARLGVRMLDLHASGGEEMMRTAVREVAEVCEQEGLARPAILAVTVLTSLAPADLRRVGVAGSLPAQVARLARLAAASGMSGVVASPHEIATVRKACGGELLIVTPGVRPAEADWGDQKRVMTPQSAVQAGADYLVVGRPIGDAAAPRDAARAIVTEMAAGFAARGRTHPA